MSKTLIKFKLHDLSKLAYLNNYMESIFHDVEYIFFWWDAPYQVYTYGYQYTTNGRSIPSIIDHDILASNGVRKDDSVFIYVYDRNSNYSSTNLERKAISVANSISGSSIKVVV